MQTLTNLITYVFHPNPGRTFSYYIILIILIALMLGFSVFLRIHIKKNKEDKAFKRLFRDFPGKLQLISFFLIIYLFFRYYSAVFLSMRIFLYMILLSTACVIYMMVNAYLKKYPLEKKRHEEQISRNKYLPGKKK